jgi:hypothetical protein
MVRSVLRWLDSPWAFDLLPGLNKLGRNPTNDFRVSDPSVSSFHAELIVENDVVRVRDLGSTNGTFLDDARIEEGVLTPQNTLRLGNVRLKLEEVPVIPVCTVPAAIESAGGAPGKQTSALATTAAQVEIAPGCTYHPGERAIYRCENCAGAFCANCVTVVGQGKFEATTICPVCKGQCYALPSHNTEKQKQGFLGRLTQTLKLPFSR